MEALSLARTGNTFRIGINGSEAEPYSDPMPLATRRLVAVCPWRLRRELQAFAAESTYTSQ